MSYVAPEDLEEARAVLAELKRIEQEISDIAAAGRALVSASDPEIEPYRERANVPSARSATGQPSEISRQQKRAAKARS